MAGWGGWGWGRGQEDGEGGDRPSAGQIRGRALPGPTCEQLGGGAEGSWEAAPWSPVAKPEALQSDGAASGSGAWGLVPAPLPGRRVLEP